MGKHLFLFFHSYFRLAFFVLPRIVNKGFWTCPGTGCDIIIFKGSKILPPIIANTVRFHSRHYIPSKVAVVEPRHFWMEAPVYTRTLLPLIKRNSWNAEFCQCSVLISQAIDSLQMTAIKATNQSNSIYCCNGRLEWLVRRSTLGMTQMHTDQTELFSGGFRQFSLIDRVSKCMNASKRWCLNYSRSVPS